MLQRLFVALAVMLVLGGCAKPPYTSVDNAQLKTLLAQGVPIYDVRRAEEWQQTGVVEGSRTLTWVDNSGQPNPEFLPRFTAEVDKNAPVILICRSGNRTDKLARELMEKRGYTQVYNVREGITGWIGEKRPVVKS
ncbi:rhodanese-like domain-containing protein [Sulfuriferula sp.]|uniref:rhodanese-like domain-containing protein n=1 Tax=Sulfuriferula sp. TaxID=2025307 RepID=UPI00273071B4|nr:rhodanese-like domain-containing protein [Sulfuriferula sp.]MDP2027482.1 rhodanese-like domain-containing protein [Sulfuriferula sp.]